MRTISSRPIHFGKLARFVRALGLWGPFVAALPACAIHDSADMVRVTLENSGNIAMRCQLRFGHWVDRDLGTLEAGRMIEFAVSQDEADGALFIMRSDGKRRMMIETIECWRKEDWEASFGNVDLAPARAARPKSIAARCAAPVAEGRVACEVVKLGD